MFSVFSCCQLELYQRSGYLGKRGTERENKGCGIRDGGHLMCSLQSLGPLSIPSCHKPWTWRKKKQTENTHQGEEFPIATCREQHCSTLVEKSLLYTERERTGYGKRVPLSRGRAEPYNCAPSVPQHPPATALPTPRCPQGQRPLPGCAHKRWGPLRLCHPPLRTTAP